MGLATTARTLNEIGYGYIGSWALAKRIPEPEGPVFDLGGGWGAMANAIADRHGVDVDVVDLEPVVNAAPRTHDQVNFHSGSALDATTWPSDRDYDGAVLSYLFSSVPGSTHGHVLDGLQDANVRWVAVHGFFLDSGAHAPSWSLQHAVFVPGHTSRTTSEVGDRSLRINPSVAQSTQTSGSCSTRGRHLEHGSSR